MSFDLNPINPNMHSIQKSQKTTDGGGGNTGYFKRDGQPQEKSLLKQKQTDTFILINDSEIEFEDYSLSKMLKRVYLKLLVRIRKILRKFGFLKKNKK